MIFRVIALAVMFLFYYPHITIAEERPFHSRFGFVKGKANMRKGPGTKYKTVWQYSGKHTPVEVMHQIDNWYMIKDVYGDIGWVSTSLISFHRRYGIVTMPNTTLCHTPSNTKQCLAVAKLEKGLTVPLKSCTKHWCRIKVKPNLTGWTYKSNLWGVHQNEII